MTFEEVQAIRKNPTSKDVDNKELSELIDIAIDKQIPKKAIPSKLKVRYCEVFACPRCGHEFSSRVAAYCYRCGQALSYEVKT